MQQVLDPNQIESFHRCNHRWRLAGREGGRELDAGSMAIGL